MYLWPFMYLWPSLKTAAQSGEGLTVRGGARAGGDGASNATTASEMIDLSMAGGVNGGDSGEGGGEGEDGDGSGERTQAAREAAARGQQHLGGDEMCDGRSDVGGSGHDGGSEDGASADDRTCNE